jgi:hypothetical protein
MIAQPSWLLDDAQMKSGRLLRVAGEDRGGPAISVFARVWSCQSTDESASPGRISSTIRTCLWSKPYQARAAAGIGHRQVDDEARLDDRRASNRGWHSPAMTIVWSPSVLVR